MPIERSEQLTTISFGDFTGGMNTAQPGSQIAENEAQLIENYEYDYNRLRTRGGLSAPLITLEGDEIESFFYDQMTNGYLIFGKTPEVEKQTAKIYFADISSGVKDVGTLTGRSRPVCCKFGGDIFIASGGKLQVYDFETLKTIDGSYLCDNVFVRRGSVVTTHQGDDNLYYSSIGDAKSEQAWVDDSDDDSSSKFVEVGYKDDGDIIACKAMSGDLLVFKSNGNIYSVSGEYPSWVVTQIGENSRADATQKSIEIVGSNVVFITQGGIRGIESVLSYGNFSPSELGYKINKSLSESVYKPMCWNLISKRQLVIAPDFRARNRLFVYQYNMGAGYILTFPEAISDMADTTDGISVSISNRIHRWGFKEITDNGKPIKTRLITRKILSGVKFFTRKYDINITGEKDGAVLFSCGKQSWIYRLNDGRHIKHLYDTLTEIELELTSVSNHEITGIALHTMMK